MTRRTRIAAILTLVLTLVAFVAVIRPPAPAGPSPSAPGGSAEPTAVDPAATDPAPTDPADDPAAPPPGPASARSPALVGAADIGRCDDAGDEATAAVLARTPGTIFTAGDNAYPDGEARDFSECYDPSWGAFKNRTRPALGNHDYHADDAAPYFDYFGAAAGERGKGWYAFDHGGWRIYVLNSNCRHVGCGSDSEQVAWLRADLASHRSACVGAIWHHPRFSSSEHGNTERVAPFWAELYKVGAAWVVNGHDHVYERFAPQNPSAEADPAGIRQFTVGTGGRDPYAFKSPQPNSEVRQTDLVGLIRLTLHPGRYNWEYLPAGGSSFRDSGSGTCKRR